MIYLGDLSLNDASVLAQLSKSATNLIEFGVGASTQIFAQSAPDYAKIISIDTDDGWIERTSAILYAMNRAEQVIFKSYTSWISEIDTNQYDLVFVDGIDHLRFEFAYRMWDNVKIGGQLLFHDTRRFNDVCNMLRLCEIYFLEIKSIELNIESSNITQLIKKLPEPYDDWNITEQRSPLLTGNATVEESIAYIKSSEG